MEQVVGTYPWRRVFVLAMQPSLEVKKKLCSIFFLKKEKKEKNTVWGSINKKKSYKMMPTFSLIYKREDRFIWGGGSPFSSSLGQGLG